MRCGALCVHTTGPNTSVLKMDYDILNMPNEHIALAVHMNETLADFSPSVSKATAGNF